MHFPIAQKKNRDLWIFYLCRIKYGLSSFMPFPITVFSNFYKSKRPKLCNFHYFFPKGINRHVDHITALANFGCVPYLEPNLPESNKALNFLEDS
jgi:hypothetical protein